MNLAVFLNRDIYSNVALNHLLPTLRSHRVWIFFSDSVGKAPSVPELDQLRLLEQVIPNDFLFPLLEAAGREQRGSYLTFGQMAADYGFTFATMNAPNAPDSLAHLESLDLDLVVSIRYGRIFKAPLIGIPRHGILNLHSGILPAYRGVLATLHALLDGATEIGCTLHFITDSTIDTGPIVDIARIAVEPSRSLFAHVLALYEPGSHLLATAIRQLEAGQNPVAQPQSRELGTYYSYPAAEDLREFATMGYVIVRSHEYAALLAKYLGR